MKKIFKLFLGVVCSALILSESAFANPFAYVASDSQNIHVIDLADNSVTTIIPMPSDTHYWGGASVDEDNHLIYFGNIGSVSIFDYLSDSFIATMPMSEIGRTADNILSEDGTKLFVPLSNTYYPGTNERVEVFDTATRSLETVISLEGYGSGGIFGVLSPDGARLYVTCRWTNNVVVVDAVNYQVLSTIDMAAGYRPFGPAITSDGSKLYVPTRGGGGYLNIIDANPTSPTYHQVVKTVWTGLGTGDMAKAILSPDETKLYYTFPDADKLVVLNTITDEIHAIIDTVAHHPSEIMLSPDGKYRRVFESMTPIVV